MKNDRPDQADAAAIGLAADDARATRAYTVPRRKALPILIGVVISIAAVQAGFRMTATDPSPAGLHIYPSPREFPALRFADANGTTTGLGALRGKVVLLNVWATWCPPCIKEMPALDRLQATLGGPDFEVVALSIDEGGAPAVKAFFRLTGVKQLRPYVDAFHEAAVLGSVGIPLTLLIDREGREIGRKLGSAEWDRPQMVQLIREHLARTDAH